MEEDGKGEVRFEVLERAFYVPPDDGGAGQE